MGIWLCHQHLQIRPWQSCCNVNDGKGRQFENVNTVVTFYGIQKVFLVESLHRFQLDAHELTGLMDVNEQYVF